MNIVLQWLRAWLILFPLTVAMGAAGLQAESASGELVIQDGGQSRRFALALDELWLDGSNVSLWGFSPTPTAETLRAVARARQRSQTNSVSLVLYEVGTVRNEFTRRLLTRDVLVRLDASADSGRLAVSAGVEALRKLPLSTGWAIAHSSEPAQFWVGRVMPVWKPALRDRTPP